MNIKVMVSINDGMESALEIKTPDDLITLHSVEDMVSNFVGDRLILAGYPKPRNKVD